MEMSKRRLWVLRSMYLLLVLGQLFTIWPGILFPAQRTADSYSVVSAFLAALSIVALLGIRYPTKMLPILLFELLWKAVWMLAFALPALLHETLDDYAASVLIAVGFGLIITPIAVPWKYVVLQYWRAPADPFR